MGVVYKALDLSLDRFAALKFLPASANENREALTRLKLEARAASSLDHPNICTIYEIATTPDGDTFIAMSYYEGETLHEKLRRGRFEPELAVNYAAQMAKGLARAHRQGIVHRDFKPANVMLSADGTVKVLDFGLAKLTSEHGITSPGVAMGTIQYMSPEQARGENLDARTDQFSWGLILYQMLTGKLPFRGEGLAMMRAIAFDTPDLTALGSLNFHDSIRRVIEKALAQNRDARFRDMDEALGALTGAPVQPPRTASAAPSSTHPAVVSSIAVLPFRNLSSDPEDEYFGEGLAEEVLNVLTGLSGFDVASRASSFRFRDVQRDPREIAEKLKVSMVLDGTVRRAGKRLRVSVQLVDAATDRCVWSDRYDGVTDDLFAMQDQISARIIGALRSRLGESLSTAPSIRRYTENLAAYNLYLQGRHQYNRTTDATVLKAIEAFEKAVETDPGYVLPWVGIADCYVTLGSHNTVPPREAWAKARLAALKALELAPDLPEAHSCLGVVFAIDDLDWASGEEQFLRAIELDPGCAHAHFWYALCVLTPLGRAEEALREAERALELEPLSLTMCSTTGWMYYFHGQYEEAVKCCQRTLELNSQHFEALWCMASACRELGRTEESLAALQQIRAELPDMPAVLYAFGHVYALTGRHAEARAVLRRLQEAAQHQSVSPMYSAYIHAALNEFDEAFACLETAFAERNFLLRFLRQGKTFKPLQNDPRFADLVRRLGFNSEAPPPVEQTATFARIEAVS
jgi:serine/threonine protein kinase/Flp pilus assembly protein TadD